MKVYQVGHGYKPESCMGVIEYLYQLTVQLLKEGVEVTFIQFDNESEDNSEEKVDGVTILHFPKYRFGGMSLPDSFSVWLNELTIHEKDFIFHLHSVFYLPNYSVAQYLKKRNIPYIHTPHDSYSKESMRENRLLKSIYIKAFDKSVMDGARTVHAITLEGAKSISQYTTNTNIKLITNFVPETPQVEKMEIKKQLCFIGRMDIYQKGIDLMLESFSEFIKYAPGTSFVLVGLYLDHEITALNALLEKFHLNSSQVKVMGKVSAVEKYQILSESYAYFQLSRFEGFGLSIVEALSMAKPVIISDNVPIHEVIHKYEAGYIASDAQQALTGIKEIFELHPQQYKEICTNAYRCYQENFNPELITKQLLTMYELSL
jgi:glycosyltransferase involved in cell wall biosynthesis